MKRIAVIGFGFMGVVHAKNILASDRLELCGIVDNRGGDLFAGLEKTGNRGTLDLPFDRLRRIPVFSTLAECAAQTHPDAAVVAVPLFLHARLTEEALSLGLDVLLEKPFCPEPEPCRSLVRLARENKRILMVAHCVRFMPAWEFLADRIRDGRFGALRLLTTTRMGGEPAWGVWRDETVRKTCGGSLFDLLIHDIDFAGSCFGTPETVRLNFHSEEYWEFEPVYRNTSARISIKGGFLHRNTAFAAEYAATFEQGSIRFSTLEPDVIRVGTDAGPADIGTGGDGYVRELEYFAGCIEQRVPPERCLPEESLAAVELCGELKRLAEPGC
jgi:predicted dehydrogenase